MTAPPLALDEARARFAGAIERGLEAVASRVDDAPLLAEMARAHLATGGKRLRALLPPWVAESRGGRGEDALPWGVALELIHNATLVHDDVQDGDTHRRGHETIWRVYGVPQAINLGDALYFQALEHMAGAPRAERLVAPICRALIRVIEGQVMEFQLQVADGSPRVLPATLASWERMARGKTGALFGACLRAGAVVGGASAEEAEGAAAWGELLGLLFQVQDDLLDLVGDKGRDRRGSDLAEGKLSFPVCWALTHAPPADAARLLAIVDTPRARTGDAMVDEALALLAGAGALDATAAWLREARDGALADPVAASVPGLVDRVLAPVAHAL